MKSGLEEAIITTIYGAYYTLRPVTNPAEEIPARPRGRLRLRGRDTGEAGGFPPDRNLRLRHPLMVGDRVRFKRRGEEGTIESLAERRNAVYRANRYELQALGSNLDRAIVVASLTTPDVRPGFIDRFLASAYAGGVPAMIVFSKYDLLDSLGDEDRQDRLGIVQLYRSLGFDVFALNLTDKQPTAEWERLESQTSKGTTLLAGPSGAGKSTLLNGMPIEEHRRTGRVSDSTGKGRHTTTNSDWLRAGDAAFIDTPGVREWGIHHLTEKEVFASFPELRSVMEECGYRNCDHSEQAQDCAVQRLLNKDAEGEEEEGLHPERLRSMHQMLGSLEYTARIRTGDYIKETGRVRTGRLRHP